MFVTIKQILGLPLFLHSRILAGSQNLDNPVRMATIMEVPDIIDWISADEFIISTLYPYKDSVNEFTNLIQRLHRKGVAGLAVKPLRFIQELPPETLSCADELGLPIIELPPDARFDLILMEITSLIVNADYHSMRKSSGIVKQLLDMLNSGRDLESCIQVLSDTCMGEFVLYHPDGTTLAKALPSNKLQNEEPIYARHGSYSIDIVELNQKLATLKFTSMQNLVNGDAVRIIEDSVPVLALILRNHKHKSYKNIYDFFNDCLSGKISGEMKPQEIDRLPGFTAKKSQIVCVVQYTNEVSGDLRATLEAKAHKAYQRISATAFTYLIWSKKNEIILLFSVSIPMLELAQNQIKDFLHSIFDAQDMDVGYNAGIGNPYGGIAQLKTSYQEAKDAIRIGKILRINENVFAFADLGPYVIIDKCTQTKEAEEFAQLLLRDLINYDQKKKMQLLLSLEELLTGDNMSDIAKRLFIHPKTLLFRKRRIEKVLNISLDNMETRFSLMLAIRILRLRGYLV